MEASKAVRGIGFICVLSSNLSPALPDLSTLFIYSRPLFYLRIFTMGEVEAPARVQMAFLAEHQHPNSATQQSSILCLHRR